MSAVAIPSAGSSLLPPSVMRYRNPLSGDLCRDAVRFDVYGVELLAASLNDIVRSKEAADRPQDRQDVVIIREMLRRGEGS